MTSDSTKYLSLLGAVQSTMPSPRPWEGQPDAGDDLTIAAVWLLWQPDVMVHQTTRLIRRNARERMQQPGGRRQTFYAIRKHADEVDPFIHKGYNCDICGPGMAALRGEHYHRKADGAFVPPELLKGIPRGA